MSNLSECCSMSTAIHETAVIDPSCEIGENVSIGPYACIGPNVKLGDGCVVHAHAIIHKNTEMGSNNTLHSFASIGGDPQFNGNDDPSLGYLIIGDSNTFHEYCTVSRGHTELVGKTQIGNGNYFMTGSHIGHDCTIGNDVCLINNATIAGSVIVEDGVTLSAYTLVHQFCRLGRLSFIAPRSYIVMDVAPFVLMANNKGSVKSFGLNKVGLQRSGMSSDDISMLKKAYKIVFRSHEPISACLTLLGALNHPLVHELKYFIETRSKRGLTR
jgi:UDP-N-acetylglucosamine acyltransferase